MSRLYDIAERMKNGNVKPEVKVDDDHVYKINTSKSAALFVRAVTEEKDINEFEKMDKIITITLGKEALDYINEQDFAFSNINTIVSVIMAAISDISLEELEESIKEDAKKPGKKSK